MKYLSAGWSFTQKSSDLKLRHQVRMCGDGICRNSMRQLTNEERLERFMSRVKKIPNGCWQWLGAVCGSRSHYGSFWTGATLTKAHRFSYEMKHGKIPKGMLALHKCDNGLCVNPDHIFVGTQKENMADCAAKGRLRPGVLRGEANPVTKITKEQVLEIKRLWENGGITQKAIAARTMVSLPNVGSILQGRSWRHATGYNSPLVKA